MPFFFIRKFRLKTLHSVKGYPKSRRAGVLASATIEASLILSLLLFAFFSLLTPFLTLYIQVCVQASLENACTKEAIYAYTIDKKENIEGKKAEQSIIKELVNELSELQIGREHVEYILIKEIGLKRLNQSCIEHGLLGLNFEQSKFLTDDEIIDLVVEYSVKIPFLNGVSQNFVQRARRRAWVGKNPTTNQEEVVDDQIVYITPTGTVYHLYEDCSHIKLSVKTVAYNQLESLRNSGGGIYHECEKCKPSKKGVVYITDDGDRYHAFSTCSGIKRTVKAVHLSEVAGRNVCKRCQTRENGS